MSRLPSYTAAAIVMALALAGCVVAPHGAREPIAAPMSRRAAAQANPAVRSTQGTPVSTPVSAPMYFYPEHGQDAARQDRDRYECYRWAVGQSGFDPGMTAVSLPAQAPQVVPARGGGEVAAGAVTGAVIGSVASSRRHSGSGAVIGAIFGAALGAIAQESRAQAVEQANAAREQSNQAARQAALAPLDGFRRAMSACMLGRGYRVG